MRHPTRRQVLRGSLALAGLGLLSGCGAVPPPAHPVRVHRIGVLSPESGAPRWDAFRDGLRELGYVEGENLSVEYRWSAGGSNEELAALAAELVGLNVACLVISSSSGSLQAKRVTTTIPVVAILFNQDAVESGLVANIARPEGNITGLAGVSGLRLYTKLPEFLKDAIPDAGRIGVIAHPQQPNGEQILAGVTEAARRLGLLPTVALVQDRAGIEPALAAISADDARGLVFINPLLSNFRAQIAAQALAHRLAAVSAEDEFPRDGGLMSYSVHRPELFRRAATYVDKLLRGGKPADLPMERPTTFDLVINVTTARALGLSIPPSVLQQATEIIQ